ncbi:Kinase D-interacting substrate of 220 kDa [Penicillium chrysogenum]|uniref:Kinase D-interacting substrate of 220 kDa n=1 Tax=Penicillium chrysogenum TaxID=5076 RepID=A0A167SJK7_PENCH|nr:Kinase D-interacting substrate of 220 kDa [Penicillium chrysogenum]
MLSILFFISLFPFVKADDDWDDFTNNLATDLAPLITLFGERLTKQFLSESISILDNVIFALSPLGVLTAVVSVIRICGSSSLRAFVGRAQEGPAEAESELLPCVSESTAELFNDGGITRVFGRPKIVEIVAWQDVNHKTGEKETKIGTLKDALEEKAWSCNNKVLPTELPELDIPNLSLNKGIKRRDQFWFHCAAILGGVLQTGTITYATLTVFVYPQHFKKDDKAVASYAFPLYLIGTTLLFLGMFFCAFIMERSSKEFYLKAEKPSKIYWLQPGNQDVGDQVFNAFLAVNEGPESSMTKKLRYTKSIRDRRFDRKYLEIYSTLTSTVLGFIFQFIGLRGLHASVILAQLGSTFIMSIIRTCLRTERMAPDENKMKDDRDLMGHKQQELDAFAFYLENVEYFNMVLLPDRPATIPSPRFVPHVDAPLARQLIRTRTQLANLTSNPNQSSSATWDDMPIRRMAHNLAQTIESTMDLISGWGVDLGKTFEFRLGFECRGASPGSVTQSPGTYSIGLMRCGDALRWKMEASEIEAILGLWTWSLYKSGDDCKSSRLFRLVGLSEEEASKKETYLYFHKWIFRQTEARLVPSDLIDDSRRLFGFEPKEGLPLGNLLVIKTENEVETMAAQDIFIQFLKEVCLNVKELGGEVDVVSGIQNSLLGSCTRIDELVSCFEAHSLGSREDALLCIVPVLRNRNLLPDLAADCAKVRARREQLISQGKWKNAFDLLRWLCERSEGPQFQRSVYELGYLCLRALLNNSETVRKEGFAQVCKLLNSDIREEFLQTQKILLPSDWSMSQDRIEWWRSFSSELGWTAWSISEEVPGMSFMEPALKSLNVPQSLPGVIGTGQDLQATEDAMRSMQDWLTLRDLVNAGFRRLREEEDNRLCFEWAVENNYHCLLYFLLLKWVELNDRIPFLITIAYTLAATKHSHLATQTLLRQGTNIDATDVQGHTALFNQAAVGHVEGIVMLLDNGADPNGSNEAPNARPLIAAVYGGHLMAVALLLQYGADANMTDQHGMSALLWAMASDYIDIVELLLSSGAETESVMSDGSTALIWASTDKSLPILELLIKHGADINAQDTDGKTALMRAVSRERSLPVLRVLLDKGADVHMEDDKGRTALDMARKANFHEAVAILKSSDRNSLASWLPDLTSRSP